MTRESRSGVIAAGHRMTAEAGADVLRAGGTAIDATIAAIAMACVCEPVLCSPGGGGFAMVRDGADDETSVIDFFPQTPLEYRPVTDEAEREVHADFGTATQAFRIGPATTATPGFFAGIERLAELGAAMPLATLFGPAIRTARAGVAVTEFQHHLSSVVEPILTATPSARALFAPGGRLVAAGDQMHNPGLAAALEVLAAGGFHGSPVEQACIELQDGRGHLRAVDFERYRAVTRRPLTVTVGECAVHMNPLPAAGGTLVAHSLRHLESEDPVDVARALHATGRARAAADGDLAALANLPLRQRGTTHISVVDATGSACAVTMSNGEGNGELVEEFGFMLNNVLGEEDVNPAGPTGWSTDQRLSSMMCPSIIEAPDGSITALGTGGSNRIRSAVCQLVVHLCLAGRTLQDAVEAPRLHVEGDHLDFEDHFPDSVRDELGALFSDRRAWPRDIFFGGVHAARRLADGTFAGVGDARRDGYAIVVE